MFKIRTSILPLAAIASLGLAALVTTTSSADARGFGGGGMSRGGGMSFHGGMNRGGGFVNRGGFRHIGGLHRFPRWHQHRHWHVRWHRPWIYGVGIAAAAAPAYAAVAPRPCTCLTKEYTQDNVVVFKDLCTKETAAAPVGGMQQSQAQPGDAEPMPQK
jgi:hypothetical protein